MWKGVALCLLLSQTVVFSYATAIAGELLPRFFKSIHGCSLDVALMSMPPLSLSASKAWWFFVLLYVAIAVVAASPRGKDMEIAGLALQWLVAWTAAFCFCYGAFTGASCLHHDPHVEPKLFLHVGWGVFPLTLFAILAPLVLMAYSFCRGNFFAVASGLIGRCWQKLFRNRSQLS